MIKLTDAVSRTALAVAAAGTLWSSAALADPLALFDPLFRPTTAFDQALRDRSPGAAEQSLHRAPVIDEGVALLAPRHQRDTQTCTPMVLTSRRP